MLVAAEHYFTCVSVILLVCVCVYTVHTLFPLELSVLCDSFAFVHSFICSLVPCCLCMRVWMYIISQVALVQTNKRLFHSVEAKMCVFVCLWNIDLVGLCCHLLHASPIFELSFTRRLIPLSLSELFRKVFYKSFEPIQRLDLCSLVQFKSYSKTFSSLTI